MRRLLVAIAVAIIMAGLAAPPASAIYIPPVECSGCNAWPLWLQVLAPAVGVGLGFAFVFAPYRLSRRVRSPRARGFIRWGGPAILVVGFVVLARLAVVMFGSPGPTFTPTEIVVPTLPDIALPFESSSAAPASQVVSEMGVPVVTGDQTVVVEKVERWGGDGLFPPNPGDVYVTVSLAITPSTDSSVDTLDARVQARDGPSHPALFVGTRDPGLPTGTLSSGVTIRGWMTFEVPSSEAGHLTLLYQSFIGPSVAIALY